MLPNPKPILSLPAVPKDLHLPPGFALDSANFPAYPHLDGYAVAVPVDSLRVHPSVAKLHIGPSEACLISLAARDPELIFGRVWITEDNVIVGGYDVYYLALRKEMNVINCCRLHLVGDEALKYIIRHHTSGMYLNAFTRVELAAEVGKDSADKAKANQIAGGRLKALSILTNDKRIDRRKQIACLASVSTGTARKVSYLKQNADKVLLKLLRADLIRIHPAWKMATEKPGNQKELLAAYEKAGRRRRSSYRTAMQISKHAGPFEQRRAFDVALHALSYVRIYSAFCQEVLVMLANHNGVMEHKEDQNA
jgi:hypothetical protein